MFEKPDVLIQKTHTDLGFGDCDFNWPTLSAKEEFEGLLRILEIKKTFIELKDKTLEEVNEIESRDFSEKEFRDKLILSAYEFGIAENKLKGIFDNEHEKALKLNNTYNSLQKEDADVWKKGSQKLSRIHKKVFAITMEE